MGIRPLVVLIGFSHSTFKLPFPMNLHFMQRFMLISARVYNKSLIASGDLFCRLSHTLPARGLLLVPFLINGLLTAMQALKSLGIVLKWHNLHAGLL